MATRGEHFQTARQRVDEAYHALRVAARHLDRAARPDQVDEALRIASQVYQFGDLLDFLAADPGA